MMKTRFFAAMSAVLVLGLTACQKEEAPEVKQETKAVTTIMASIDGTKTAVEGDGRVTWSQGDKIAVKCGDNFGVFTLKDEYIGQTSACFEGEPMEFPIGSSIEAYYPASVYDNVTSKCTWPSTQTYSENAGCPMYSTAVVLEEGKSPVLTFSNLGSILRLKIAAATADPATVASIKISSSTPIAGEFTVADAGDGKYKAVLSSSDVKSITLDCGESGIDGTKYFNVAVPANVDGETKYEGFNVDVKTKEGKFIATASKPLPKSLVRNTVYTVSIADNWGLGGANCYIVAPNKTYVLRATLMGNATNDSGDQFKITTGSKAELLFETYNTDEAPVANSVVLSPTFGNGLIHFTTGSHEGSAVIAVKDGEDNILWSWHIWVVEGGTVADVEVGDYTFLSREIGARNNGPQSGFLYQGGRKDPLPAFFEDGTTTVACTPAVPYEAIDRVMTENDIFGNTSALAQSITNPTRMIKSGNSEWWYADKAEIPECYSNLWNDQHKALCDPCPYGYCLPSKSAVLGLYGGMTISDDDSEVHLFDGSQKYYKNFIVRGGMSGSPWSCLANDKISPWLPYARYVYGGGYKQGIIVLKNKAVNENFCAAGCAISVRCIKEN